MARSPSPDRKSQSGFAAVLADTTTQRRLKRILTTEGYQVRSFTDDSELIVFLRKWIPDVLLVDVRFAGGNYQKGLDLARKIRELKAKRSNSSLPVVICLSSLRHPVQEEELRRQGAEVAWLSAPNEIILDRIQYGLHVAR